MGIIVGFTPKQQKELLIPLLEITSRELKGIAKIDIHFCKIEGRSLEDMFYTDLKVKDVEDTSANISLLCSVVWPKRIQAGMQLVKW
jgi:hypothetical protein